MNQVISMNKKQQDITIVKKYANRRLYNTATSIYITLEDLREMIQTGEEFKVVDAKTAEDITRQVLAQIILEQESKGGNLLPINFLKNLIGFYGNNMQDTVPHYLDVAMDAFQTNQERWQGLVQDTFSPKRALDSLDEIGKNNVAMFERTMKMMMPFGGSDAPTKPQAAEPNLSDLQKEIADLKAELKQLKTQS